MSPPHMHISFDELVRAGLPATITVGDPGAHGDVVFGMQGMGVKTPRAAAVAAATAGFAGDMHMPNGAILAIGIWSMIFASGICPVATRPTGRTVRVAG